MGKMEKRKTSVLIVLIAGIGDLILASKSIRAIRNGYPDADIHLLTNSEAVPIAKNYQYIDYVWAFPIREMRKDKRYFLDIIKLVLRLRKIKFDFAVNLYTVSSWPGAIKMGFLFLLLEAKEKIGHDSKGFGLFIDKKASVGTFRNRHFADAMLDIALLAGGVPDTKSIEIFWDKKHEGKWGHLFFKKTVSSQEVLIGVNPGGDRLNRRWNPDYYAFLADQLIEEFNAKVVFLGGHGEEDIAGYIESKMKNDIVNLAGKLTLNDLVYLISRFDLLITNDSGPMHIGAAVGTRLVAVFGPEDPVLMGPYSSPDLYRVVYKDVSCRPCNKKRCDRPVCLDMITPEEVYIKCVELLNANKSMQIKG
ncbi:MAG: glycosyltransferase family 9 protein [Thermodesulfobacteriota bacterium]|nr:glycosyltransferase family 9 protein [Thermodesulfobacteriota bacterium]